MEETDLHYRSHRPVYKHRAGRYAPDWQKEMHHQQKHCIAKEGAGKAATSELTREREFSERTLDAEVDDPGLKKERRERWPSRDPPPVVHKRDA
ncbi:hypothetical protein TNCV_1443541 [Trichonephila clavipes]|nr:hypothetical protein TNCV_1443541 [Trichonephila clavipes]